MNNSLIIWIESILIGFMKDTKEIKNSVPDYEDIKIFCLEKLATNSLLKAEPTIIKARRSSEDYLYEYSFPRDDKACDIIESRGCILLGNYTEICLNPPHLVDYEAVSLNSEEALPKGSEPEFASRDNELCKTVDIFRAAIGHYCPTIALSGEDQLLYLEDLSIIPLDNDQGYPRDYPNIELPEPDNVHICALLIAAFLIKFFYKKTKKINTQYEHTDVVQAKQSPTSDQASLVDSSTTDSSRRVSLNPQVSVIPNPVAKRNGGNPCTPPGRDDQDEISTQASSRRASFGSQGSDYPDTSYSTDHFEANPPNRGVSAMPKTPTAKKKGISRSVTGKEKGLRPTTSNDSFVNLDSQPNEDPDHPFEGNSRNVSDVLEESSLDSLTSRSASEGDSFQGYPSLDAAELPGELNPAPGSVASLSQESPPETPATPVAVPRSTPTSSAAASASQQPLVPESAPDIAGLTQTLSAESSTPAGTSAPVTGTSYLKVDRFKLKEIFSRYSK